MALCPFACVAVSFTVDTQTHVLRDRLRSYMFGGGGDVDIGQARRPRERLISDRPQSLPEVSCLHRGIGKRLLLDLHER